MGILIDAPQDKAYERGLAEGRKLARVARLAEEREYGFTRGYADGFAKGFIEGRAEGLARVRAEDWHRRAQDWYRRFKDALDKGEPFDEPPPDPPSTL